MGFQLTWVVIIDEGYGCWRRIIVFQLTWVVILDAK